MFLDEHECSSRYVGMRSAAPMVPNCHDLKIGQLGSEVTVTCDAVSRCDNLSLGGPQYVPRPAVRKILNGITQPVLIIYLVRTDPAILD